MKKILLLGGSSQQTVAIDTAKRLGYYTVLCDYLTDNPGQYHADKFYLVSTTDKDAVLTVAMKEKVDGVLAYASDPAAPTAAYVAEKLGLAGNPYESVEILCNKDKFREFLLSNGFNAPKARGFSVESFDKDVLKELQFPIMIKPVDSSGSKGITVLYDISGIDDAVKQALQYSRCKRFIAEEYIQKSHLYVIGGDIIVKDGKVAVWGLLNCHRDSAVNTLVPVGKSFPLALAEDRLKNVKNTLQNLVSALKISNCCMNVELIIDKDGRVFPVDIGPRSGGNMIPELLGLIFGIDVVEIAVKATMGESYSIEIAEAEKDFCYATHNLHSAKNGHLTGISFSDEIEKYIVRKAIYKKESEQVLYFDNASKALGIIFMKFETEAKMKEIIEHISEHITIEVR